ncbi:MAG: AAA family ATPase [Cyanophyceae cyanobacterium]
MAEHLSALVEQMHRPHFYPHSVEKIEVIQTHASIVFLTGAYAYKLKKPVDFGFLNYSTLAQRKHFCEQELQINQKVAAALYLEVLPIAKQGEQFVLGGTGEAVEYVLKMRQFPQENLFLNMFEQGKLTEAHLNDLGKIVANFHAQAQTNDYIRRFGKVSKIRESIEENYQQTQKYIGIVQTDEQYQETKQFTDTFLTQKELFQKRRATDKIKECHGDLHLKNICFWQNKIQLFDRIEFNEAFRFVDVMYDVAFTVMDLEARHGHNLGNAFLNSYLEETGDWEGLQVLPFYLCRQAYVRAKVNSFLLDEEEAQQVTQTAADYYRLAWSYTKMNRGKIILMSGLSGSGKSTVAQWLARRTGAIQIRSDAVRKHLAGIPVHQRGGSELYTPPMNDRTYTRLLELGNMLAGAGYPVILDAKFDRCVWRQKAIALAQAQSFPLQILYCTAPVEVLRNRLHHRQDISDATADLLAAQQAAAESFTEAEQPYVVTVNTAEAWTESNFLEQVRDGGRFSS